MPKGANQKLKLIYLIKIMLEKTDEEHGLTRTEIESALEAYGVTAERKSIYSDFEALGELGIDVMKKTKWKDTYLSCGIQTIRTSRVKIASRCYSGI